ncbi:MAG: response regulator, partial [Gemmatimonadota bacterium]
ARVAASRGHAVTLFEASGFQLEVACDGSEALDAVRSPTPYDLVLLDIVMPVASGLEVLSELRGLEHRSEVPVIVLTAKGQDADRERAFALGASAFITKPFSPKKLLNQVDALLAGR